jgi:hypothetical protein
LRGNPDIPDLERQLRLGNRNPILNKYLRDVRIRDNFINFFPPRQALSG